MQPRSAQSCKIYRALRHCNIVICACNSSFYLIRLSIKRSVLFHLITHSSSCKHLISPLSFQHPVFQHQFTRIPGSPRIVTQLPLPNSPWLEHYSAASSSFHTFCTTLTLILQYPHSASILASGAVLWAHWLHIIIYLPQFTIPSPPTPCTNPPLPPLL